MPGVVHVVDDDASFRTAIERRLKKAGYEVATYQSAQHLLDRLPDQNSPGCILLDVRIPGLSGPELQGRLSELGSAAHCVSHRLCRRRPPCWPSRPERMISLTKPVSSDQLLRAIQRAMAHHEACATPGQARHRSRAYRITDAARARGFRACRAQPTTSRSPRDRRDQAHHQGCRHRVMEDAGSISAELASLAERVISWMPHPPGWRSASPGEACPRA